MSAYVDHRFENGYLIDESSLRKLHEIITNRLNKLPNPLLLKYKVYRGDSYSYETTELLDIFKEDNEDWRAIKKLELIANEKDKFDFNLLFADEPPILRISGEDRDSVFLILSDLREYMKNDILVKRIHENKNFKKISILLLLLVAITLLTLSLIKISPDVSYANKALSNSNINDKLNFLINDRLKNQASGVFIALIISTFSIPVILVTGIIESILSKIFPTNQFLFGKRKINFDKHEKLMNNIFWVVIVGMLVTFVGGIFVWFSTR